VYGNSTVGVAACRFTDVILQDLALAVTWGFIRHYKFAHSFSYMLMYCILKIRNVVDNTTTPSIVITVNCLTALSLLQAQFRHTHTYTIKVKVKVAL
jgi:hypothetical protein